MRVELAGMGAAIDQGGSAGNVLPKGTRKVSEGHLKERGLSSRRANKREGGRSYCGGVEMDVYCPGAA